MRAINGHRFEHPICQAGEDLLNLGRIVEVPTWQALDVREAPQGRTHEMPDYSIAACIPADAEQLAHEVKPNLPWAENQFQERVSGEPLNPGETFKEWPWYKGNVEKHKEQGKFSHTYMERYWPKYAEEETLWEDLTRGYDIREGIRYNYGDLNDVVNLLAREPTTRQAYLPVFFPEDTGAVHGERIPCSLGYLFLMRENKLNITYYIRSCDFYRHFRDDVYMTARLCQWMIEQCIKKVHPLPGPTTQEQWDAWKNVTPGRLTMHIGSLHIFEGDLPKLRREYGNES